MIHNNFWPFSVGKNALETEPAPKTFLTYCSCKRHQATSTFCPPTNMMQYFGVTVGVREPLEATVMCVEFYQLRTTNNFWSCIQATATAFCAHVQHWKSLRNTRLPWSSVRTEKVARHKHEGEASVRRMCLIPTGKNNAHQCETLYEYPPSCMNMVSWSAASGHEKCFWEGHSEDWH